MKKLNALRPAVEITPTIFDSWELKLLAVTDWTDYNTKKHLGKKYEVVIVNDNYEGDNYPKGANNYEKFYVKIASDKQMPVDINDTVKIVGIRKLKIYGAYNDGINCEAQGLVTPEEYEKLKAKQGQR